MNLGILVGEADGFMQAKAFARTVRTCLPQHSMTEISTTMNMESIAAGLLWARQIARTPGFEALLVSPKLPLRGLPVCGATLLASLAWSRHGVAVVVLGGGAAAATSALRAVAGYPGGVSSYHAPPVPPPTSAEMFTIRALVRHWIRPGDGLNLAEKLPGTPNGRRLCGFWSLEPRALRQLKGFYAICRWFSDVAVSLPAGDGTTPSAPTWAAWADAIEDVLDGNLPNAEARMVQSIVDLRAALAWFD